MTIRALLALAVVASNLAACSKILEEAIPTSPSAATQPGPPVATTAVPPAPVPNPEPEPTPDPDPTVDPTVPPEPEVFPDRKTHPKVVKLEFVNPAALCAGLTLDKAGPGSGGSFWDTRRVTTEWSLNDKAFKDAPHRYVGVFLGSKPGYVTIGTSVNYVRMSTGQAWFMYTLYKTNAYHLSLERTVHLTLAITEDLDYNSPFPDGRPELPLADPRILAYRTISCPINWRN